MGRYRKILVAIDGSESSMHALRESFRLASVEKSWITVVSVAPSYEGDLSLTAVVNIHKAIKEPCEKALSEAMQMAKAEGALIKPVCEVGEPFERIVDLADAENCDLIVMGKRGLSAIESLLAGSVAKRVIGYAHRDVLVVPKDTHISWDRILLATDGSKSSRVAAERAIDFAKSYSGELKVVSVVNVPSEFYGVAPHAVDDMINKAKRDVEEIKNQADSAGVKTETFVIEGEEAYREITKLAREQNINTIVMGSHGRTGLKRLLMGSVAEKVIGHSSCPVLIATD